MGLSIGSFHITSEEVHGICACPFIVCFLRFEDPVLVHVFLLFFRFDVHWNGWRVSLYSS